jgi:hypothetical protein
MKKILILSNVNDSFASVRQRVYKPLDILCSEGLVNYSHCSFYSAKTSKLLKNQGSTKYLLFLTDLLLSIPKLIYYKLRGEYDLIIIKNHFFPIFSSRIESLVYYLFRNSNIVFDIDDAIYLNQKTEFNKIARLLRNPSEKVKFWGNKCDVLMVSNKYILDDLQQLCNLKDKKIYQRISFVDEFSYVSRNESLHQLKQLDTVNFIWLGSPHTQQNLNLWFDFICKISKVNNVVVYIIGTSKSFDLFDSFPNVVLLDWSLEVEKEILRKCHFGLNPLENNEFEKRKSAFKVIQYYRAGIYPIVSNVGINKNLVDEFGGAVIDELDLDDVHSWIKIDTEVHEELFDKTSSLSTSEIANLYKKILDI